MIKFVLNNSKHCMKNHEVNCMIDRNDETHVFENKHSYVSVIIVSVIFFVLLLMRDVYSVGINKYVFLALICICAIFMRLRGFIYLYCFLFPLYVGLPGNYMTVVLVIRMFFEVYRFKKSSFVLATGVAGYIFLQNIFNGHIGIVPMMIVINVVFVLLLFTYKTKMHIFPMIIMYSAGVASLGFIMLISTLKVYDLMDLMSTSFRLGSSNVNYVDEKIMNVSVDPNFYGLFSIASISNGFLYIFSEKTKQIEKILLIIFTLIQLIVCLIGLSRTFVVLFILWIVLYLVSQKNIRGVIIALIAIGLFVGFLFYFMPDVIEIVLARFEDSDMTTGNGRSILIQNFWKEWSKSIYTILFGVGLYSCNVHCLPLQFLFGGGVVLFSLILALCFSFAKYKGNSFDQQLPFIVTFMFICTVPAATLLNFIFPIVLVGFSLGGENN